MAEAIAHSVASAIIRTSFPSGYGSAQIGHRHTLLIYAHLNPHENSTLRFERKKKKEKGLSLRFSKNLFLYYYLSGCTLGTIGREARIDLIQPKIHDGRAARYDLSPVVDERVAENRYGFHTELQSFVQVLTVKHSAQKISKTQERDVPPLLQYTYPCNPAGVK